MTTVNEYNFQIDNQGTVSPNASEAVPPALLEYVKAAVDGIQKSQNILHKELYRKLLISKSFKVNNDGKRTKQVPFTSKPTDVLTLKIQTAKGASCPIDCFDPDTIKKIEECFNRKVTAIESSPLKSKDIKPVKKGSGIFDAFFAWIGTVFGACAGRPSKKLQERVVRVEAPATIATPKVPTASPRVVPDKPLPSPPVRAETAPQVRLRGIGNEGNTCFINAVFQMIMNDEALTAAILETYLDEVHKQDAYQAGYQCFIDAVVNYRDGQPVSLKNLRVLLSDISSQSGVQGDGSEILTALLRPINQNRYPQLFVALGTERKWTRFTPPENKAKDYQRVFERRSKSKDPLSVMPPNGEMPAQYDSKGLIIPLQIPEKPIAGQALVNKSFDFHSVPVGEETAYQDGWYQPVAEKLSLKQAPERCIIQLKRFKPDGSKINTLVDMPENLNLQGQKYCLKSIAVHVPGHYYALIRKGSEWFVANDSSVSSAQDDELRYALNQGYLYFYEKV